MHPWRRDPILCMLPDEVPDEFARLPPVEQAWRGRLWLIMFGAGYEPVHAWWFVMSDEPDWVLDMRAVVARVDDDQYGAMVQARLTFDAGKTVTAASVH